MQQVCNLKDKRTGLCKTWLLFEEPGLGAGFFYDFRVFPVLLIRVYLFFYRFQGSQRAGESLAVLGHVSLAACINCLPVSFYSDGGLSTASLWAWALVDKLSI